MILEIKDLTAKKKKKYGYVTQLFSFDNSATIMLTEGHG